MNLLIVTSALHCGGAETHVVTLARALRRQGHSVTVASAGGELAETLKNDGIGHHTIPLDSCLHLLSARRRLKRLLKENSFDLIHTHSRIASFVAFSLARWQSIPLITTVHARFRATPLLRKFSRWGASPIAVSEDLKQYLCECYRVPPDRVTVIPNGIETPAVSTHPPADKPRLIFCSRLDGDCSQTAYLLCQIAPRLRQHFPDLEILLVGGGTEFPNLQQQAKAVNEAMGKTVIRCIGKHPSPAALFSTAHAVVGVSRVALEAMATQTPVILAGNEGFLGVAEEAILPRAEATNFCCRGETPLTADKLYESCRCLLSMTDEERSRLAKPLSEYVKTHHSMSRVAAQTQAVYQNALQDLPTKAPHTLLLCGYYGYGNMGDDALLAAALRRAKQSCPTLHPAVLTKHGKKDTRLLGVRCVKRLSLQTIKQLNQTQLLVFGGGTILQDLTSLRSLCYYAALIRYAKHRGTRVELWANGIHPPTTALGRRILLCALRRCDRIGLRDHASLQLAKELLGERAPLIYEQDLAYPTPAAPRQRIEFLLRHYHLNGRFAVIAPKGGSTTGILKIFTPWLCTLRAEGIRLAFVPLYPKEDEFLCRTLAVCETDRVMTALSASDLVGLMEKSEVVCGMRLHSLIFAASANTPFVGFGLDPKIESFCREHGGLYFTDL